MFDVLFQLNLLGQVVKVAVHPHPDITAFLGTVKYLGMFALPAPHHRRKQLNLRPLRKLHDLIHNLIYRLLLNLLTAVGAMRNPDAGIEQTKIIINLRHRAHRGTRVAVGGFLVNGDGRGKTVNPLHIGFFHLAQELPCIRGERFHVASLPFRIDGIKSQGGFPGTG